MPPEVYYFCRYPLCGHYSRFVAKEEDVVKCPKCDRPMVRQDVAWVKVGGNIPPKGAE